jgi:hypothetical protein
MDLLDTLRQRTARKGGTARVECGELGLLTVEALPQAECVRLARNSRALFYAACRELQSSGETLRKEGKVFRPDEVLTYVTNEEVIRGRSDGHPTYCREAKYCPHCGAKMDLK